MTPDRDQLGDDLRALLAVRQELGPDHEDYLVERFLDQLEGRTMRARDQRSSSSRRSTSLTFFQCVGALLVLWMLIGLSCIATGLPWSLGSTAPAQVFAAAVGSGYASVLMVLLVAFCIVSAVQVATVLSRRFPQPGHRLPR